MLIEVCKSKLAYGRVTEAQLFYEGSITIDEDLLKAANILPGEKVQVLNVNSGERFSTYTIAGKAGGGDICLNGPAARLGVVGDQILVVSYALMEPEEAKKQEITVIQLDEHNRIKN